MKKYTKPELDIIEIKASDIFTNESIGDGDFDMPEDIL